MFVEKIKTIWLLICVTVLCSTSISTANENLEKFPVLSSLIVEDGTQHAEEDVDFWEDAKRGWFYYEKLFFDPEKADEKTKNVDIAIDWKAFKNLAAGEMNRFIGELKNYAVTYPSKINVQNYMTAQKIAAEKAKIFMTAWMDVLRDHPVLDETVKRPPSSFVSFNLANAESEAKEIIVKELAADPDMGLVFFYSRDNYYAAIQSPIFKRFLDKTRWRPFKFINVDENPQAANEFGIETVPEIWLASKNGGKARVTAGVRTEDIIQDNIVTAYELITGVKRINDPFKFQDSKLYRQMAD